MTATAIDAPTFDALKETTGEEFVRELVDMFLTEAPGMLEDLRVSLGRLDADRFRRAAHSLKSNANTFGALKLGSLARDLELSGVSQVSERGDAPLTELGQEYARVAQQLQAWRHE
jgi:HPt (histidine-containing phosphotransfer) domain-containing protein